MASKSSARLVIAGVLGVLGAPAPSGAVRADDLHFSAMPVTGSSPLAVTFFTRLSGFRPPAVAYVIAFGDGTSERAADCPAPADACQSAGQNTHTYTRNGTYTATLERVTDPCAGRPACRARTHRAVVGTLRIWVGTAPVCTKEYKPVCGAKPVVCITTPCNPVPTTYGNRCEMDADGAAFLHAGRCRDSGRRGQERGSGKATS
jgi:hypothetical protein